MIVVTLDEVIVLLFIVAFTFPSGNIMDLRVPSDTFVFASDWQSPTIPDVTDMFFSFCFQLIPPTADSRNSFGYS